VQWAVHAALVAVGVQVLATAGDFTHSAWEVVSDECIVCGRPPKGCMCI
jgi:hypothetical protein